jgi:hypothetical protein
VSLLDDLDHDPDHHTDAQQHHRHNLEHADHDTHDGAIHHPHPS